MSTRKTEDCLCAPWCDPGIKLTKFADDVFVGIFLVQDRRIVYANPRLVEMTGRTERELAGEDILSALFHPDDSAATLNGMDMVQSGTVKSFLYQDRWLMKDGSIAFVEGAFTPTTYRGRPALICTAVDITERKKLEQDKTDFLEMVTHDFKTPLATVMGYAALIESMENLDDDVAELAEHILSGGRKLLGMVEDFLFHARLESGSLSPEFSPVEPCEVVSGLVQDFSVQASGKGQKIVARCGEGLPALMMDGKLIERALSNLLQNAVNYSGEGGVITVEAELRSDGEEDMLALSVSDTGPGIPPQLRHRLFDKYVRSSASSGVRGAGLGLTIVKSVAQSHGGRVEVKSEDGRGSTFTLLLPAIRLNDVP